MRRFAMLLTVALLAAACAAETVTPLTTTTVAMEEPSATTTTTVVETTSVEGSVDLCQGRSVVWDDPEVVHVAGCFAVPVSFSAVEKGWRSRGAKSDTMFLSWRDPADDAFGVSVGFAASRSDSEVRTEIESVVHKDGIAAVGPISDVSVAGFDALMVDVEGMRLTGDAVTAAEGDECQMSNRVVLNFHSFEAYVIAGPFPSLGGEYFGVGACRVVRVWVFDVGAYRLTVIGGTIDRARHEEAVAKIEELFEGMSFDVGAGS